MNRNELIIYLKELDKEKYNKFNNMVLELQNGNIDIEKIEQEFNNKFDISTLLKLELFEYEYRDMY